MNRILKDKYLCLCALICSLILFPSCQPVNSTDPANSGQNTGENSFQVPASEIDLEKPLEVSSAPEDVALCQKVDETIRRSEFPGARWGIIAVSLEDGRVVCGRNARQLFNPASIHKLLTSVVALDKLGGDLRWRTSVYAREIIKNGVLEGDLILYGRGAPDFDETALNKLVRQLKQKGLKEIRGDIIGDESYFTGDNLGDGWTWNAAQWYYGAAGSALSINDNKVVVSVEKGKPRADSKFVELSGEVEPVEDIEAIGIKRELGTNKIYVWGNGKTLKARLAISKPALFSAKIFKEVLGKEGIRIGGGAGSVDWRSKKKLNPDDAEELAFVESQTLAETVDRMNKDSVNLYAELLLRSLGKKFGEEAPDENLKMQKLRGDDLAGTAVLKKWLTGRSIATGEIAIHDGSGLSRLNYVTPEAFARALIYAANRKFFQTFKNSLPVSGMSGTLRGRLGNVRGKVLGKTGSIAYVNSLAGYAQTEKETLAFVIIGNNLTQKGNSSAVVDKIASVLVAD
jgi:D-alanyl-D-alanine carboxypeptidase/D-alanyl-D-alanine-endopeptidase (penicillin-binding protein 4)